MEDATRKLRFRLTNYLDAIEKDYMYIITNFHKYYPSSIYEKASKLLGLKGEIEGIRHALLMIEDIEKESKE